MEKQNAFHEIQIPHIENRVLISQQQQAFKAQSSFNRTPVIFMLNALYDALVSAAPQVTPQVTPQVLELLRAVTSEASRAELQEMLGLRDRKSFFERYLRPALALGLMEMSIPEKPNSRLQKYRLTERGRRVKLRESSKRYEDL